MESSNQSAEVMHASITSQIAEKGYFYLISYLKYDLMIPNIMRLNLAVLKISETS